MLTPQTYTGGIVSTNGYLLELPAGNVLVDAPEGIARWLKGLAVPVDALLLTHQHFDHVQDAAAVQRQYGCPVYAWTAFSRDLTLESFFGVTVGGPFSVPEFAVSHLLEGTSHLQLGGVDWRLYHVPGHSVDSLCFHLESEALLLGGDVLFQGSVGRTDFPGGSFPQLVQGIQRHLGPLPDATRVFPGHGEPTTLGRERRDNPFLNDSN